MLRDGDEVKRTRCSYTFVNSVSLRCGRLDGYCTSWSELRPDRVLFSDVIIWWGESRTYRSTCTATTRVCDGWGRSTSSAAKGA